MLIVLSLLAACAPEPTWYRTCGDPLCEGYTGPFDGVEACTSQVEGAACGEPDAQCDPQDSCNARLLCATEDPTQQAGGCPVSRRKYKHDIRYLGATELDALRKAALDLPLATWRYNGWDPTVAPRLGFIIDDRPTIPAVAPDGEHVDLYGLASMAIATVQAQQSEIDTLRARQAQLEARLEALEKASAPVAPR
jgi:hypothetical protein